MEGRDSLIPWPSASGYPPTGVTRDRVRNLIALRETFTRNTDLSPMGMEHGVQARSSEWLRGNIAQCHGQPGRIPSDSVDVELLFTLYLLKLIH